MQFGKFILEDFQKLFPQYLRANRSCVWTILHYVIIKHAGINQWSALFGPTANASYITATVRSLTAYTILISYTRTLAALNTQLPLRTYIFTSVRHR